MVAGSAISTLSAGRAEASEVLPPMLATAPTDPSLLAAFTAARDYSYRATERQLARVIRNGALIDSFNGRSTWICTYGNGSVSTAARELTITTNSSSTTIAKRSVSVDLSDRFLSFEILRDGNLATLGVRLAAGTDADNKGWYVEETVAKINIGEWYTYTLPLAQAQTLGTATPADADDVQAIRFVVRPNAGTNTTLRIRNLRTHPNATPPAVHFQFDDGRIDTYTVAHPILKAAGYTGGIAVEYNRVGSADRCTIDQLRELYAEGWSIYGHHTMQATETTDAVVEQIFKESQGFNTANGFARGHAHWIWPGGARDTAKETLAKKYWGTMRKVNSHHQFTAPHVFERLDVPHVYVQTNTSLSAAKSRIDAVADRGGAVVFVFHSLHDPKVAQEDWSPSDFAALVAYASEKGLGDTNYDQLYGSFAPNE